MQGLLKVPTELPNEGKLLGQSRRRWRCCDGCEHEQEGVDTIESLEAACHLVIIALHHPCHAAMAMAICVMAASSSPSLLPPSPCVLTPVTSSLFHHRAKQAHYLIAISLCILNGSPTVSIVIVDSVYVLRLFEYDGVVP